MSLRDQLNQDVKEAMKAKDTETRNTLRLLLAAIKQADVDAESGEPLTHAEIETLLMKQAKQRQESITSYEAAGREDLAEPERVELAVIEKYLPQMMSREEITAIAQAVIDEVGATDMKSMGAVMGKMMPKVKGKADGRLVNEVVKSLLA